jgi:DNA-binding LacI/PurR family transcriptional regulator
MAVKMKDIAERAGVSSAAVSLALRDSNRVSEAKRGEIARIAAELGFKPNLLAQALVKGKTRTIGLLTTSFLLEVVAAKVLVLDRMFANAGYRLLTSFLHFQKEEADVEVVSEAIDEMIRRGVDGLLVYGPHRPGLLEALGKVRVPIVFFDVELGVPCKHILLDRSAGCKECVEHLCELGHREIYLLRTEWCREWIPDRRVAGYRQAMSAHGLDGDHRVVFLTEPDKADEMGRNVFDMDKVHHSLKQFLLSHPDCTAIMASSDELAECMLTCLHRMGLSVPRDISLTGFNNISSTGRTYPALTTIAQPADEIGRSAVAMILKSIESNDILTPEQVVVPTRLIIRESTGPARRGQLRLATKGVE